jgi:uncharacterized membrane protein YjgN (DUF898 family)
MAKLPALATKSKSEAPDMSDEDGMAGSQSGAQSAPLGRGSVPDSGPASGPGKTQKPDYRGRIGDIAGIALTNGLLGLVTLGFYRFWGKTRLRRYLWGRIGFDGDAFEYTGTAKELLIGFLVAIAVLIPLSMLASAAELAFPTDEVLIVLSGTVQGLSIMFLVQFAIYRARRYRLTRTQWRGIRAGQTGSAVRYAFVAMGLYILLGITFGLAYPVLRTALQRYRTENTWLGTERFFFQGRAGKLFWRWFLAWLLLIPTLGLSYGWYRTVEFRYFAASTRYGGLSLASELHAGRVIWIWLRYMLVLVAIVVAAGAIASFVMPGFFHVLGGIISDDEEVVAATMERLGAAFPLVLFAMMFVIGIAASVARLSLFVHPMLGAICRTLSIHGEADFDAILQSQQARPTRGEGFADALDVGAI